ERLQGQAQAHADRASVMPSSIDSCCGWLMVILAAIEAPVALYLLTGLISQIFARPPSFALAVLAAALILTIVLGSLSVVAGYAARLPWLFRLGALLWLAGVVLNATLFAVHADVAWVLGQLTQIFTLGAAAVVIGIALARQQSIRQIGIMGCVVGLLFVAGRIELLGLGVSPVSNGFSFLEYGRASQSFVLDVSAVAFAVGLFGCLTLPPQDEKSLWSFQILRAEWLAQPMLAPAVDQGRTPGAQPRRELLAP